MPIYRSNRLVQAGYGLGGFLRGLGAIFSPLINLFGKIPISKSVNVLRKIAKNPIMRKTAKHAKKQMVKSELNVVKD